MSRVYFLSDGGRAIKIGYSVSVEKRLKVLSTGSSERLFLLGSVPGTRVQERDLQRSLDAHRVNGEWFRDNAEVRGVVNAVLSSGLEDSGFARTKPRKRRNLPEPSRHMRRAVEMVDLIACCGHFDFKDIENRFGLSSGLLWRLRYSPPNDICWDDFIVLHSAALQIIDETRERLLGARRAVEEMSEEMVAFYLRFDWGDAQIRAAEDAYERRTGINPRTSYLTGEPRRKPLRFKPGRRAQAR